MSAPPPRQPGQAAPTPISPGRGQQPSRAQRRPAIDAHPPKGPGRFRRLRLTSASEPKIKPAPRATPMQGTADPRWVLAVRTAEVLEGDILRPEHREKIIRMAKLFGLTPFDANMIIAIVQDQARRGIAPHLCPTAGEPQLRMITPPRRITLLDHLKSRYGLTLAVLMSVTLIIEALLLWWVF